jgi:hypothetical protein
MPCEVTSASPDASPAKITRPLNLFTITPNRHCEEVMAAFFAAITDEAISSFVHE